MNSSILTDANRELIKTAMLKLTDDVFAICKKRNLLSIRKPCNTTLSEIMYRIHANEALKPMQKWEQYFSNMIFDSNSIWKSINNTTANKTSNIFQWKGIQMIISTDYKIKQIQKANGLCNFCLNDLGTKKKHFVSCNFNLGKGIPTQIMLPYM